MEQITLGQIALAITFVVGLIGGIGYLKTHLTAWVGNAVKDQLTNLDTKITKLNDRIETVDLETCKNFLVVMLNLIERGETMSEIQTERFWEEYEHYRQCGGNSYIKAKVEKLQADGKI